ncbi:hypothetical protein [Nocardia alni]|uniref:hypothetical protein n=1 Tax=Nocardia alni TaxID=2815723 RepID=UPI001C239E30|nr:hypothetical protein [Nocardia alni]
MAGRRPHPAPNRYDGMKASVVVLAGGKSPTWLRNGDAALAQAIPNAQHRVIDGQNRMIEAHALAPVLTEIFTGDRANRGSQPPGEVRRH